YGPVPRPNHLLDAEPLGKSRMGLEMPALAMHRDGNVGLHPAIELLELAAAGVTRDMNRSVLIGDDFDLVVGQPILHARHRLLVAGDGARGEDHPVAGFELHIGMLAKSDAGHGGARLALAAGAERYHLVRPELGEGRLLEE